MRTCRLSIALLVLLAFAGTALGQNVVTNTTQILTYTTITDALAAAAAGDAIVVGDGTYNENFTIPVGVSLTSENGAALTTIAGSGGTIINIQADDVEISGFTLTNPSGTNAIVATDQSNLHIHDNVVNFIGSSSLSSYVHAIAIVCSSLPVDDVVIEDNALTHIEAGEYSSASAITVGWSNGTQNVTNLVIQNNSIDYVRSNTSPWNVGHGAYGILINHATGSGGQTVAPQILNNTINDLEGLWAHGIGMEGDTPNALVSGNTLTNLVDHKDPSDAIAIFFEANASAGTCTVVDNTFGDVTLGIASVVTGAGNVMAAGNYYGDPSGPLTPDNPGGLGVAVFGEIDYSPWYIDVVGTSPMTWATSTGVQAAIDAANPGDTINILAGHYEEQLHVTTENLTLVGAGVSQTFIDSPENLALFYATSSNNYPVVFVDGVDTFTMSDLTVDGLGRGNNNYRFQGVGFWNAGGSLTHVDVVNVMDTPFSGSQHGVGVYTYNNTGGPYTVNLTGVTVENYQKGGIAMNGAGLTANVVDCVTAGFGATDVTAQNGIQFYGGDGGTIDGCSVTGNIYTGGNWAASGILLIEAGQVEITDTNVADGDPCVYCQDTSASVEGLVINNNDVDSGNGFYTRIDSGVALAKAGDMPLQADASPFGDFSGKADGAKGIATVTITNSTLTGQTTGYGISCSNYVAADLIDITVTNCAVKNWGWGAVLFGSGGEIDGHFSENGFLGNGGFFYADAALTTSQEASGNVWGTNNPADLIAAISGDVIYTPWLAGGTENMPGFTGDFTAVHVDDDGHPGAVGLIQEGIDLVSGSTVNIAPGTYVESGQILIDEDINLIGDASDRPVIMTDTNTGTGGDARGWFLQVDGTHLVMQNLELDGAGYNIWQGIRAKGSGVLNNCAFRNIVHPGYQGAALAAFGAAPSNWNVTNCSFENIGRIGFLCYGTGHQASTFIGNTYTGKGPGDWLDYACDISAGANLTVEGNTITACQGVASSDGSTSAGLLVSTYFAPGTTAAINDNILTGNSTGVAVGYDASDVSIVSGHGNTIAGNDDYGVSNTAANTVDFLNNWWGDSTGPFHPTLNPSGTGNEVDDYVLFEPWSGQTFMSMAPATSGPVACGSDVTLTVSLTTDTATPDVFGFSAVVRATGEVDWNGVTDLAAFGGTTQFWTFDNEDGTYLISGTTTGGNTQPISGAGTTDLFSMTFTAMSDGVAAITFDEFVVRDTANNPIGASATGATITVDCTAPPVVTDITAIPAPTETQNGVDVGWTMADPSDVDHYEIWRAVWHTGDDVTTAYPEYDDVNTDEPVRAASYADLGTPAAPEWTLVSDTVPGTATSYTDLGMARGVYYYEVVAIDAVDYNGPLAAAIARATSYYLGDFDLDGEVEDYIDVNTFGAAFGTQPLHANWNNLVDIGPTDTNQGIGIPETDNFVGFEDLMIFSLNYGVYDNGAKSETVIGQSADVAWVDFGNGSYGLRLLDSEGLKGVHLRASLPADASVTVVEGELLTSQETPVFLRNLGNGLDVSLSVLGRGVGFAGEGDLMVVESSEPLAVEDLVLELRGADNSRIEVSLSSETGTLTPRVFGLYPNFPNPFNPQTKISFSLPESQPVRLNIYGIDGKLVRQLVNETRGAGLHEVIWDGRGDGGQMQASGMYFYRIEAGPYSQVRKMTLMK